MFNNIDIDKIEEEYKKNILSKMKTEEITIEMADGTITKAEVEVGPTREEFNDMMEDSPHIRGFFNSLFGGDIFGGESNE